MPFAASLRPLCEDETIGIFSLRSSSADAVAITCAVVPPTMMTSGCFSIMARMLLVTVTGLAATHCVSTTSKRSG